MPPLHSIKCTECPPDQVQSYKVCTQTVSSQLMAVLLRCHGERSPSYTEGSCWKQLAVLTMESWEGAVEQDNHYITHCSFSE